MPTSRNRPTSTGALVPVLCAVVAVASSLSASSPLGFPHRVTDGLSDLRDPEVLRATERDRARGRQLLEAAAERQGRAAWRRYRVLEVVGVDRWPEQGPWWPQIDQRVSLEQLLGTFTSRARLLDGPRAGEIWGVQAWRSYQRASDEAPASIPAERHLMATFYLPTLHYFNELVFRLLDASLIVDAGERSLGGRAYDRVFVSWGASQPRPDADQYVLWIGKASGLVEKAHYTVRDVVDLPFVPEAQRDGVRAGSAGTIHFEAFRDIGGVQFPFVHTVTLFGPEQVEVPLDQAFVHRFEVESVRFDTVEVEALLPLAGLPAPGDRKPAGAMPEPTGQE